MRVITAPDESRDYSMALFEKTGFETPPTVFLAGTITGASEQVAKKWEERNVLDCC